MSDYIDRQAAIEAVGDIHPLDYNSQAIANRLKSLPSADVAPVVRCKDCVHQTKFWHNDGRMKNGGYYICGCDLADGYSHVCLDDDFCSRGERRDGDANAE